MEETACRVGRFYLGSRVGELARVCGVVQKAHLQLASRALGLCEVAHVFASAPVVVEEVISEQKGQYLVESKPQIRVRVSNYLWLGLVIIYG